MTKNLFFYDNLPKHEIDLVDLFAQESLFVAIPEDWHVIVVDVEKSTQAVKNGLHQEVNLTATGSIIAVLNKLKSINQNIKIPYFFGGDGATFIVPPSVLKELLKVLENFRHHARKNLYLSLKVGSLPIKEVHQENQTIKIARLTINPYLNIPIVLGNGLKEAERIIKSFFIDETEQPEKIIPVDLDGLECRWKEVESPNKTDRIICLVLNCLNDDEHCKVYHQILSSIDSIFGNYEERHPISTQKLKLDLTLKKMWKEMNARLEKNKMTYLIKNWMITILGSFYFSNFKEGKAYLDRVHELSCTTMIDGTLNTVISGTTAEINKLINELNQLEAKNKIIYGIHITHGSIMSCYIEDREAEHIHFIDGTEGGYTSAAKMLKKKLAK